jgi:pimeloyl-ACP methyl ester carboxylesterase
MELGIIDVNGMYRSGGLSGALSRPPWLRLVRLWRATRMRLSPAAECVLRPQPGLSSVGVEMLPHTGHLLMEEQPERFAERLLAFLTGAEETSRAGVGQRRDADARPA